MVTIFPYIKCKGFTLISKGVITFQSTLIAPASEAHQLIWGKLKGGLERDGKESSQRGGERKKKKVYHQKLFFSHEIPQEEVREQMKAAVIKVRMKGTTSLLPGVGWGVRGKPVKLHEELWRREYS